MNPYQERAFDGASGIDLTIALYDGMIRFMRGAILAVERGDVRQRRAAVKRAMDIIIHLQATLKADVGGAPAKALGEFYAAMFALMLQGSQANSKVKFEEVIKNVWEVREAWRQASQSPVAPVGNSTPVSPGSNLQPAGIHLNDPAGDHAARWTV